MAASAASNSPTTGQQLTSPVVLSGSIPYNGGAPAQGILASGGTFVANGATPVVVAAAQVTANSIVIPTLKTVGGTVGALPTVGTITPGTGFTAVCTAADTSIYNFIILG